MRLPEIQADGLVHVTALPRDYYHHDPTGTTLKGERSGREYRLTETLKVRLAGVNVEERKIDFVPVENDEPGRRSRVRRGGAAVANRRQHLYGLHAVRAVLERRPETVLAAKVLRDASGKLARARAGARGARHRARARRRAAISTGSRDGGVHQGVVVEVAAAPEFSIGDFEALVVERGRALRLLVLDGVEDPRNLGACLRTADAAGVDAVVVPKDHSAKLTAAAVKTSTGAAETVPVFRAPNLARALAWLKEAGVWVVGADAEAPRSLYRDEARAARGAWCWAARAAACGG